jgi:hypothetical protein
LDTPELNRAAEQEQADRYESDVWDTPIAAWIRNPTQRLDSTGHPVASFTSRLDSISIDDILSHCVGKRLDQQTQGDKNRVARCLRAAGWERYREWDANEQRAGPWKYRTK